ncbi:MAG: hypothetical protein WBV26_08655 [Candidatus Sulfotelmatobacter sp.]|jgi:hypothetical protein
MKTALVVILLAVSTFVQDQSAIVAAEAACGAKDIKFAAKQDATQHPTPQPDADKALVYVVQEIGQLQCTGCALTRVGMDGSWVGANQGSSYFFFAADPGDHHLCMNWQSRLDYRSRSFAMANFTAEAGKVYYFRARIFPGHYDYSFDLDPINGDQGKYLVASSAFSVSHPKK